MSDKKRISEYQKLKHIETTSLHCCHSSLCQSQETNGMSVEASEWLTGISELTIHANCDGSFS